MTVRTPLACIVLTLLFFRYHPENIYFEKTDNTDSVELYNSDVVEVKEWTAKHDHFSKEEILKAQAILQHDFKVLTNDSSLTKIMKIAGGLIGLMKDFPGNPGADVFKLSPLQLYDRCRHGTIEVYCTQYTLLFTFFCKMAGITVRSIESFGLNDRHSTYECFLPEENRWIWSDLLNNIIYLEDEKGKLNLLQMLNYLHEHRMLDINVIGVNDSLKRTVRLGKSVESPLGYDFDSNCVFQFYHETNLSWVYNREQRLLRFLGHKTWYARYATVPLSNTWYYLKYLCFLVLVVSGSILCWKLFMGLLIKKEF